MIQTIFDFASQYDWQLASFAGCVAVAIALLWQRTRLRRYSAHQTTALNNMSQGLCMWSPAGRLILCNDQYEIGRAHV